MKKTYQTPALLVVAMEIANLMQQVSQTQNNAGLTMSKTGGGGPARGREGGSWDDDY